MVAPRVLHRESLAAAAGRPRRSEPGRPWRPSTANRTLVRTNLPAAIRTGAAIPHWPTKTAARPVLDAAGSPSGRSAKALARILQVAGQKRRCAWPRSNASLGERDHQKTSTIVSAVVPFGRSVRAILAGRPLAPASVPGLGRQRPVNSRCTAHPAAQAAHYRKSMGLATPRQRRRTRWGWTTSRVYGEGEDDRRRCRGRVIANQVRISTEKIQKLSVRTEAPRCDCSARRLRCRRPHRARRERRVFAGHRQVQAASNGCTSTRPAPVASLFGPGSPERRRPAPVRHLAMQGSRR